MGRITTNIGLITGFPIQSTVDQLIALQARPRDLLIARNQTLQFQQSAIADLTATLISLQLNTDRLKLSTLYSGRSVTTSASDIVSVSSIGTPAIGSFQLTAARTVQSQQLLSSKFASDSNALGAGELSLRSGRAIDEGALLDLINSGNGFARGTIRITDRSGASADIDLRLARTSDDVLKAINSATGIRVTATTHGDRFVLNDTSGGSGNLKIAEVDGSTAASLGLAGIDVAANVATGQDILSLFNDLSLSVLNDGNGVIFDEALADLAITFRDGTSLQVDLLKLGTDGTHASGTTDAANGVNAQVTIRADEAGEEYAGIVVAYQDDPTVSKGNETVEYDEEIGTIIFKIDAGGTTASDVVAALNGNAEVAELFTASLASGSSGDSLVDLADTATLRGPQSTATTPGTLDPNSAIKFTAVTGGPEFDNVTIEFVHNGSLSAGEEIPGYNDSNPNDIRLTIQINESESTASHIVEAVNNHSYVSQFFTAELADGSDGSGLIDVANDTVVTSGGEFVASIPSGDEATLGGVLDTLNSLDPAKLLAEISADGERILLTDLTTPSGSDSFTVTSINGSKAAEGLGITTTAAADTIAGRRLLGGLKSSLVSSLNGGAGLELGLLQLTDRGGQSTTIDLSGETTVDGILAVINSAGIDISARINDARNGILLTDTSGSTTNNLFVASGADGLQTAEKLGLVVDAAVNFIDGGSLNVQTIRENTKLSSLNGGAGVAAGSVSITDTLGATQTLQVNSGIETIGDLIEEIERLGLQIDARINDAGDGIVLIDTAFGTHTLTVEEGESTTGRDLHLVGEAVDVGGTQQLEASTTLTVTLDADDTLQDLRDKLNELGAGLTATIVNDGTTVKPFRLSISADNTGKQGRILFDASQLGISFEETVAAQDALLIYGDANLSGGILASSSSNLFNDVVEGLSININQASIDPVTVTVAKSDTDLVATVIAIVDTFNRIRDQVDELTAFDPETEERGLLQGDGALLRVEFDLGRLVTDRHSFGSIQTLADLGITVDEEGRLSFDKSVLKDKFAAEPEAVEEFLTRANDGISDEFDRVIEQLVGAENSLLLNRTLALGQTIASNELRIELLNARLEGSRERLVASFVNAELAISKIQADLSTLSSLSLLAPLSFAK